MEPRKPVRQPKQQRSMQMKEKIRKAALKLFCEKGYYKTTTNEIAKVAGISIGSLYSYFKDKDVIFMEILEDYNKLFVEVHKKSEQNMETYRADKKAWLRQLIEALIKVHETSRELNQEIRILSYSKPEVAAISGRAGETTRKMTLDFFRLCNDDIRVKDIEAASVVVQNMISSNVDYIVFEKNRIDRERIIEATIDAVYKYLAV